MESKYVNDDGTLTKAGLDYWKRLVARPWPLVKSQEHRDCHDLAVASLATILALGIDAIVGADPLVEVWERPTGERDGAVYAGPNGVLLWLRRDHVWGHAAPGIFPNMRQLRLSEARAWAARVGATLPEGIEKGTNK